MPPPPPLKKDRSDPDIQLALQGRHEIDLPTGPERQIGHRNIIIVVEKWDLQSIPSTFCGDMYYNRIALLALALPHPTNLIDLLHC